MQMTPSAQPMPTIPSVQESADDSILNCLEGSRCVYSEGKRCFYSFMPFPPERSRGFADNVWVNSQALSEYQHRSVVAHWLTLVGEQRLVGGDQYGRVPCVWCVTSVPSKSPLLLRC